MYRIIIISTGVYDSKHKEPFLDGERYPSQESAIKILESLGYEFMINSYVKLFQDGDLDEAYIIEDSDWMKLETFIVGAFVIECVYVWFTYVI